MTTRPSPRQQEAQGADAGGPGQRPGHVPGRARALFLACTALVAAGVVARVFGGIAVTSWAALRGPSPDSAADLIVLVIAAAGTLLSAWLGLSFATAALATLPGTIGAAFELVADRVAPAAVRRTVAVVLGTALTASLLPGTAGAAARDAAGGRTSTSWSVSAPDPAFRPVLAAAPGAPDPAVRPTSAPPPRAASGTTPPPAPDPSFRPTTPTAPATTPATTPNAPATTPATTTGADGTAYTPAAPVPPTAPRALGPLSNAPRAGTSVEENVVVRRGDTLWDIAARHLGGSATNAEIAHEWPRWHAANRAIIGDDPDHIRPGQRLTPPTGGAR